jgi:hypothetical protein
MNQKSILMIVTAIVLTAVTFSVISAQKSNTNANTTDAKSVAWFVANLKEARAQNQLCHDDASIQATPACENALHALQISFKGGN